MGAMESSSRETSPDTKSQAQALINWDLAASAAARLTPAGPSLDVAVLRSVDAVITAPTLDALYECIMDLAVAATRAERGRRSWRA